MLASVYLDAMGVREEQTFAENSKSEPKNRKCNHRRRQAFATDAHFRKAGFPPVLSERVEGRARSGARLIPTRFCVVGTAKITIAFHYASEYKRGLPL
jgi:hypothetical protein